MSADNWTYCPHCKRVRDLKFNANLEFVQKLYGKVPLAEFEAKRKVLEDPNQLQMEETLREDYSLGVDLDGTFSCNFKASCTACRFSYRVRITIDEHGHNLRHDGEVIRAA